VRRDREIGGEENKKKKEKRGVDGIVWKRAAI